MFGTKAERFWACRVYSFHFQKLFESNLYFVRIVIRIYTYSNNSQSRWLILKLNPALNYSCSLKQTFVQSKIFSRGNTGCDVWAQEDLSESNLQVILRYLHTTDNWRQWASTFTGKLAAGNQSDQFQTVMSVWLVWRQHAAKKTSNKHRI